MIKYYSILEPVQAMGLQASFPGGVINNVHKRLRPTGVMATDVQDEVYETRPFVLIKNEHTPEQLQAISDLGGVHFTETEYLKWLHDGMGYSHVATQDSAVKEAVTLSDGTPATVETMGFRTEYATKRIFMDVRITYADGSRREEKLLANNQSRVPISATETIGEYDYLKSKIDAGVHPEQVQRESIQHRATINGGARFDKKVK